MILIGFILALLAFLAGAAAALWQLRSLHRELRATIRDFEKLEADLKTFLKKPPPN